QAFGSDLHPRDLWPGEIGGCPGHVSSSGHGECCCLEHQRGLLLPVHPLEY
ncbi:unnamed protein product, partial [Effrenium voratum]